CVRLFSSCDLPFPKCDRTTQNAQVKVMLRFQTTSTCRAEQYCAKGCLLLTLIRYDPGIKSLLSFSSRKQENLKSGLSQILNGFNILFGAETASMLY
ncbi:MAG: hypothetical protein WBH50_26715, partial [Fuerstiella sp.]